MLGQFRVLQIVWMVMGLSQLILLAPAIFIFRKELPRQDIGGNTLLVFSIVLLLIAAIFPEWWYRKRLPEGAKLVDPEKKLEHYRAPLFMGWVLAEAANMVVLIAFMLNRNPMYLGLFGIGFALFYYRKANAERFSRDYNIKLT